MPRARRIAEPGHDPETSNSASSSPADDVQDPAAEKAAQPTEVASVEEQQAVHLRNTVPSMFMYVSMIQPFGTIQEKAYRVYRERLLADCGNPTDPVEIMVIDQLALAHFNFGLLTCRAANARQVEAAGVYASAAARLMAEFRRSALGLQAYRAASRQLAHDPTNDIVIPADRADAIGDDPEIKCIDGELDANREVVGGSIIPYPGPAAVGDQPPQPAEVARHDTRRKGKAPRRRPAEPPMGAVDRAADG